MKKYYISFGQIHTHSINGKTFDKDCIAVIESESYEDARDKAFELFDGAFCNVYKELPNMSFFPRGLNKIQ